MSAHSDDMKETAIGYSHIPIAYTFITQPAVVDEASTAAEIPNQYESGVKFKAVVSLHGEYVGELTGRLRWLV